MKDEKYRISNFQFCFLLVAFMQSMVLTVGYCFPLTEQSTWVAVAASGAVSILLILLYTAIGKINPQKSLVDINVSVFPAFIGKIISFLFVLYFFALIVNYLYFFNGFWMNYIMPETPRLIFLAVVIAVCAYGISKGIEVITRCCFTLSVIVILTTVFLELLLIGTMKAEYLLPIFNISFKKFLRSFFVMQTIPFGDFVIILALFPYANNEDLRKPSFIALGIDFIQLLAVVFRDICTLGPQLTISASASFSAARQIDIAHVLTRLDIMVAIALLITVFMKTILLYYVIVRMSAQIFNFRSEKHLIIPTGALAVICAATAYSSDMEQTYAAVNVWPFITAVFILILPALILILSYCKRAIRKRKALEL